MVFLGAVDDVTLAKEYARAKAVIFTPFLEYGLIPLEANASGTPVTSSATSYTLSLRSSPALSDSSAPSSTFTTNETATRARPGHCGSGGVPP